MGEEYHGEGGETACLVEAGYGRGDVLHHNRTSPGTDGGSYAERSRRRNEVIGQTPVSAGQLLLPPLEAGGNNGNGGGSNTYTLKVETSIGTFDNVSLTFGDSNASRKNPLQAGMSHVVTLNIGDHELGITSVTVQAWAPVTVDGTLDAD